MFTFRETGRSSVFMIYKVSGNAKGFLKQLLLTPAPPNYQNKIKENTKPPLNCLNCVWRKTQMLDIRKWTISAGKYWRSVGSILENLEHGINISQKYMKSKFGISWFRRKPYLPPTHLNTPSRSEVGGWVKPGNLSGSWVRDPVAGAYFVISVPASVPVPMPVPLWFGAFLCEIEWKIVLWDRGWSLVVPGWILVGINKLSCDFEGFEISLASLGAAAPPCRSSRRFSGRPEWDWSEIEVKPMWDRSETAVNSKWDRSEIEVNAMWNRSEIEVRPKWIRSETEVKSMWDRCGNAVRSMWYRNEVEVKPT